MSHAAMAAIMAATGAADCKWHVFTWLSEHAAEFLLPIAMEAGDNTACRLLLCLQHGCTLLNAAAKPRPVSDGKPVLARESVWETSRGY